MKCPHCQAENREGAAFWQDCGQPFEFEVVCSRCGSKNPYGVKFCDKCGHALVEPAPATEKPPSPQPTSFAGGRYKVKKFLGEGGKKKVYLAHDTTLDRDVAFALIKTEKLDEVARALPAITVVRKPYMFHAPTHKHNFTEFFYFFGSNPMDMKEFDAEIEFTFGAEKEKHIIKGPTVVVVPPGVFHCPLNYTKVGKPFYCLEVFMTSKYTGTDLVPQMP